MWRQLASPVPLATGPSYSGHPIHFQCVRSNNGGSGSKLINDQDDTLAGVNAVITPDVLGIGSFTSSTAQGTGGFLEFGRSVSSAQSVTISGDPCRLARFLRHGQTDQLPVLTVQNAQPHRLINDRPKEPGRSGIG